VQIGAVVGKFFESNIKPSDSIVWTSKLQGLQHHYPGNQPTTAALVRLAEAGLGKGTLSARRCEEICDDLFVAMVRTGDVTGEPCKVRGVRTTLEWLRQASAQDLRVSAPDGAKYYKTFIGTPGPELFAAVGGQLYYFDEGQWRGYTTARFVPWQGD